MILITGSSGFLGHHVKNAFNNMADVHYVSSNDCDLTNYEETLGMLWSVQPKTIIHMAAACGGILANKNSPADFLSKNTLMGVYLYKAAQLYKHKQKKDIKIYTLGSVCSYPKYCSPPFKEDDLFNGYPEETNAPYGQAKRTLLMLGQTYREQYGIGGAHLIPGNMYGPHDHFDLVNSHVIPALINKFVNAKENCLPHVEVWGTGDATREFLYAGDCADAIYQAVVVKHIDTPLPINIGTGQDISIKDLAFLLRQMVDYEGEIVFTGDVSDGQPKRVLDVCRAKDLLGFEAKTGLKKGLQKTIDWYLSNRQRYE